MNKYSDEDLLMLSGIQHIVFCERQWALIHMEQQWSENVLTVEGHHLHERVDDPFETETRGNFITLRSVSLTSYKIGLYGRADVVELIQAGEKDVNSIEIKGKQGRWNIVPVEYKRGKPKPDERDEVQLCAQAMSLEEMYGICIHEGFLYYGETRHRHEVELTGRLRELVEGYARCMHEIYKSGITPSSVYKPHCKSCSLVDICLPKAMGNRHSGSEYLHNTLNSI
jgi:CRISPR-associated exonuclease Cas4